MKSTSTRCALLDELRGLDLISMMLYHGMWDLVYLARGFLLLYHWGLSHPPFWRVFLFWFQVLLFGFRGVVCYALRVE